MIIALTKDGEQVELPDTLENYTKLDRKLADAVADGKEPPFEFLNYVKTKSGKVQLIRARDIDLALSRGAQLMVENAPGTEDPIPTPMTSKQKWRKEMHEMSLAEKTGEYVAGVGRGVAQGLSLGFADEILGGLEALTKVATEDKLTIKDLDNQYEVARDKYRQMSERGRVVAPYAEAGGEIAAGLATGAGVASGKLGLGLLVPAWKKVEQSKKLAAAIATAGVSGAAYGTGASEEEEWSDIATEAVAGMGIGAGAGAVLWAGGRLAGAVGKDLKQKVGQYFEDIRAAGLNEKADKVTKEYLQDDKEYASLLAEYAQTKVDDEVKFVLTKEKIDVLGRATGGHPSGIDEARHWLDADLEKLANQTGSGNVEEVAQLLASGRGEDFATQMLQSYRAKKVIEEGMDQELKAKVESITRGQSKLVNWLYSSFGDFDVMARAADRQFDTGLSNAMNKTSSAINRSKDVTNDLVKDYVATTEQIVSKLQERGYTKARIDEDFYKLVNSPKDSDLVKANADVLDLWKGLTERARGKLNDLYTEVGSEAVVQQLQGPTAGYLTRTLIPGRERIPLMRKLVKDVEGALGVEAGKLLKELPGMAPIVKQLAPEEFKGLLMTETGQQLLEAARVLGGVRRVNTPEQLSNILTKVLNPAEQSGIDVIFGSLLKRDPEAKVPEFLLDKNVGRVWINYLSKGAEDALVRPAVDLLDYEVTKLAATGEKRFSKLFKDKVKDLRGANKDELSMGEGIKQWYDRLEMGALKAATDAGSPESEAFFKAFGNLSKQGNKMVNTLYTNVLGWNPRTVLTNLTQSVSMLWPELGFTQGLHLLKGTPKAFSSKLEERMIKKGLLQQELNQVNQAQYREGLKAVADGKSVVGKTWKALNTTNELGLIPFLKSERMNRKLAMSAAVTMADDILSGSGWAKKKALEFVASKLPGKSRRLAEEAIASGNREALEDQLGEHLLAKTMFNYNAASSSNIVKDFGPVFTMFTKWPTSILSETLDKVAREDQSLTRRMANVALYATGPLASLYAADSLVRKGILENLINLDEEQTQAIMGKQNLAARSSPITSLLPLVGILGGSEIGGGADSMFQPPALQAVARFTGSLVKATKDFVQDDEDTADILANVGNSAADAASTFLPGTGLLRFIANDVPLAVYSEEREPRVLGQFEKAAETVDAVSRDVSKEIGSLFE
jgi:hypothetical protein